MSGDSGERLKGRVRLGDGGQGTCSGIVYNSGLDVGSEIMCWSYEFDNNIGNVGVDNIEGSCSCLSTIIACDYPLHLSSTSAKSSHLSSLFFDLVLLSSLI